MINLQEHYMAIGSTGSGKSYSMRKILKGQGKGVLYFNTQHEALKGSTGNFVNANGSHTFAQIKEALNRGRMINFLPAIDRKKRGEQLTLLVDKFFNTTMQPFYFVIEEVHLYNRDRAALDAILQIYTTGRKWGILGGVHSVRPAIVDNTIITQSAQKLIFYTDDQEIPYFKRYNLPYNEMMEKIRKKGKYSFIVKDSEGLKGAFKI